MMRFWVSLLGVLLWSLSALAQEPAKDVVRTITISDTQAAQILIANNRLDDAKKLLERVLAANPDDPEGLFLMATIAVEQKDYDRAISLYRRILVH
jgi:Tfp pilus assembly protein PilF